MKKQVQSMATAIVLGLAAAGAGDAQVVLLANGTLTGSTAGPYKDLSGLTYTLENGVEADLLGGLGSGLAYVGGDTFLAIPDRGPNAVSYNAASDDTVSYINRFHTVKMELRRNSGNGLPFTVTPQLARTTLLLNVAPLAYGSGPSVGLGPGAPQMNGTLRHYFTGRSDNYDTFANSGEPNDARFDPESIRVANDGKTVFISDEYGPYVYQFNRLLGTRVRTFTLPANYFVANPKPTGDEESAANLTGRTPNKGMEGLAITPDGKTLVGMMQAAFLEDAATGGAAGKLLRIAVIDIESGVTVHQYGYLLTTGSGVSEITALNDHEFLVDERDGNGLGDGSTAKVKQIFKIDLAGAYDITGLDGTTAATHAVPKNLFLDVVQVLNANGISSDQIPAKLEGMAIGRDVLYQGRVTHTLWVANDNDFEQDYSGPGTNPNQFYVFGFTDADMRGSAMVPQAVAAGSEN